MAFSIELETINGQAKLTLIGELDGGTAPLFKEKIESAAETNVTKLVLFMDQLEYMSSAGLRVLVFAKQKMGSGVEIFLVGTQEMVNDTIEQTGLHQSFHMVDSFVFTA